MGNLYGPVSFLFDRATQSGPKFFTEIPLKTIEIRRRFGSLEKGQKSVFVTSFLVHETLTHLSKLPTTVEPHWLENLEEE
jgi:hypothetical protein